MNEMQEMNKENIIQAIEHGWFVVPSILRYLGFEVSTENLDKAYRIIYPHFYKDEGETLLYWGA